ncbi:TolC family protein [Spirochaetota bacterium]
MSALRSVRAAALVIVIASTVLLSEEMTLDEQSFMYRVLDQSYDVKVIKSSVSSAVAKYISSKEMYAPKLNAGTSLFKQVNDTNNPANQIPELNTIDLSAGVSKMFVTGTILSVETGGSLSETESPAMIYTLTGISNYYTNMYSFTPKLTFNVIQPILKNGIIGLPGKAIISLNKNIEKMSKLGARMALEGYVFGTLTQYHTFIINLKIHRLYLDMLASARDLREKYNKRYELGAITESELLLFEKNLLEQEMNVEQSLVNLEGLLMQLTTALKVDFGVKDVGETVHVVDTFILENTEYNRDEIIKEAFEKSPNLLQAKLIIESSKLGYKLAQNATLPELNLSSSFTVKGYTGENEFSKRLGSFSDFPKNMDEYYDFFIGFEFSMPFLTPTERAKKLEKEYGLKKSEQEYYTKKDTIEYEIKNSLNNIDYLKKAIEVQIKIEEMDKKRLVFSERDYDNGNIDAELFMRAQDALRFTQIKKMGLELQYKISMLSLELKKGTLFSTYGIDFDANNIK